MATIPMTTTISRRVKPRVCMAETSLPGSWRGSKYATIPPSTKRNRTKVARLLVGVDIGGTFTDCVVLDRSGRITATKAPSTPGNFAEGMLAAMRAAAERLGLSFEQFCGEIAVLTHGTTVGTNALIQRKGAKVGLITTRGHEDAIHIMR